MKFFFDTTDAICPEPIQLLPDSWLEVASIAELLNADLVKAEGVVWSGTDIDTLSEIVPKKRIYGWAIASIVCPFYIRLDKVEDLEKFENIEFAGIVSTSLSVLLKLNKNINE